MSEINDSVDVSLQNGDHVEQELEENEESNEPVNPKTPIKESEPEVEFHHVESKEDMFVDAADDIEDNQFQELDNGESQDDTNLDDQDTTSKEKKEERDGLVEEVAHLLRQLKDLTNNQSFPGDDNVVSEEKVGDASLSEMVNECSKYAKVSLEQRLRTESMIKELQQQIEDLNGKDQVEQSVEAFTDRIMGSLSTVVNQEQLFDYSVLGKITHVERSTSMLMDQYRWFLYEVDQLRQCLLEGGFNVGVQEEFGYDKVFVVARGELLELKKREAETLDKLSHLEDVNRKLVEEVEKGKAVALTASSELEKVKADLELEKNRCANTKEKLSMAVTKGKALVQQRDSLKQSLTERTSELEKYMVELQEKSSAVEAAEQCRAELANCENLVASLQETLSQRTTVLENFEALLSKISVPEELQSIDIAQRLQWLVDMVASLQETLVQKNTIFETLEAIFSENNVSDELEPTDMIGRLRWLVKLVANLQEMLSQRNQTLDSLEEIFSHISAPAELQSMDAVERFRWILEERAALKSNLREFHRLKDALSLLDLPETVSSSDLETRIGWLKESVNQAKDKINKLHDEIVRIKDTARKEIDQLSATLLAELQEKEYIKMELDDLADRYEGVAKEAHQASFEKDQMVRLLVDSSGIQETNSNVATLVQRCFGKIKEQSSASFDTSPVDSEVFQKMQILLYVRDQELMLCEKLLEEDVLVKSEVSNLSNELRVASVELAALKEEKDCLQKDLERSEEKLALLREKLSLAVKKGKGLVQDRENLKVTLDEKNSEIENLKLQLQQEESTVTKCMDQINRLFIDLEKVPKLEADLVDLKSQRDQFEQFLLDSNSMLQKLVEALDRIVPPVDSSFEDPVEKLNWLAVYVNECQQAKSHAEQELDGVREEIRILVGKLADADQTINSLEDSLLVARNHSSQIEDSLSVAQNNISRLIEEKREIEVAKENVEQELKKSNEEARAQSDKFFETSAARKSLEDALSLAENNISLVVKEREEAQLSRAATESELGKVREEVAVQTGQLTEAYLTIKSLEDALSRAEANVSLLSEQNNHVQISRTSLDSELQQLKQESELQAIRLEDASTTVKSLEDALSKAGNNISMLEGEKKIAEQEIATLNSKLKACMDELAGTNGSLENRSAELIHHIGDLQMLMRNDNLLSVVRQHFENEFENLSNMNLILGDIKDYLTDRGSEVLPSHSTVEDDSRLTKSFPCDLGDIVNVEINNDDVNAADADTISLGFKKIVEGFQLRNTALMDNFVGLSTFVDKFIEDLLGKLRTTKDKVSIIFENMDPMKQEMKSMKMHKEEQEQTIGMLERDCRVLLSACTNATSNIQIEVKNNLLELSSDPELVKLNDGMIPEADSVNADDMKTQQSLDCSRYDKMAESLLLATRKVQTLAKQFESTSNWAAATIGDLQRKLGESKAAYEKAIQERDLIQIRVTELETNVGTLQDSCEELRLKTRDYQAIEVKLKEKDAELLSLRGNLLMREQEAEDALMSASELKTLSNKIREAEFSFEESLENMGSHSSGLVEKLFYIIDNLPKLHHQISVLSNDKEKLESTLSMQFQEIEHLKREIEKHISNNHESEKIKSEISEITLGLEKIIDILGGIETAGDQKSPGAQRLLSTVEKQITGFLSEAKNSKSQVQELNTRLVGSQKVVEELSTKLKMLEDSVHGKTVQPEIVQERSIFEAPSLPSGSEISEIDDVVSVGKNGISPVPSSALLRTMRKGSTEQLVLNVDSESGSLINQETDEDKGHVFKSLNTSGLIPKQGKSIADRVDGIWVSGGRVLMSRPRARLGFIVYWLFLHIWLLGTIL